MFRSPIDWKWSENASCPDNRVGHTMAADRGERWGYSCKFDIHRPPRLPRLPRQRRQGARLRYRLCVKISNKPNQKEHLEFILHL